jgi:hypothetical protein
MIDLGEVDLWSRRGWLVISCGPSHDPGLHARRRLGVGELKSGDGDQYFRRGEEDVPMRKVPAVIS